MSVTIDTVVEHYVKMRDEIAQIEGEAKERVNAIKEKMIKLEAYLLAKAEIDGVNSFKTSHGTAFVQVKDYAQVADWTSTLPWLVQNSAWDMLYQRVSVTAVRSYVKEHSEVPPGINYGSKREIMVRRPTN